MQSPWVGVGEDDDRNWLQRGIDDVTRRLFEDEQQRKAREAQEDARRIAEYRAAGWAPQPAEREIALQREFTPDPLRWVQERAEDVRRNAPLGMLRTMSGALEPLETGLRYGAGIGLAGIQSGAERYGWNPGPVIQDLASSTQHLPGADQFLLGGPIRLGATAVGATALGAMAGDRAIFDTLTGQLPERRVDATGVMPHGDIPIPAQDNIFDPRENLQRTRALAGPGEMALNLAGGNLPFGMAARALQPGAVRSFMAGVDTTEGLLPASGNVLRELFRPGMGNLAAYGFPAVGGIAGFLNPEATSVHRTDSHGHEETPGLTERITGAAIGMAAGMPVGMGAAAVERKILKMPTLNIPFSDLKPNIPAGAPPEHIHALQESAKSAAIGDSRGGEALTPGGVAWHALQEGLLRPWWDDLAPLTRANDWFVAAAARAGQTLPENLRLDLLANVTRGAPSIARNATEQLRGEVARAGKIRPDEFKAFSELMTLQLQEMFGRAGAATLLDDQGVPYNVMKQRTFWGKYKDLEQTHGANYAHHELDNAVRLQKQYIDQELFPGRADILPRFEKVRLALGEAANTAAEFEVAHGVLDPTTLSLMKQWYKNEYGLLANPARVFDRMASATEGRVLGPNYAVRGQGISELFEHDEVPQFSMALMQRNLERRYELGIRNDVGNALTDLYEQYLMDPRTKQPAIANWIRPNDKDPRTDTYLQSPNKGFARIGFYRNGEYTELLTEKSIADSLNGATLEKATAITDVFKPLATWFREGVTEMAPWFWAVHGLRQFQEFIEKTPRGELGESLPAYFNAMYTVFTKPLAEYAAANPGNPIVAGLPGKMAAVVDRVLEGTKGRSIINLMESEGVSGSALGRSIHGEYGRDILGAAPRFGGLGSGNPFDLPIIRNYRDMMRFLTQTFDEAPRVARFGLQVDKLGGVGSTAVRDAMPGLISEARTMTNDYSRKGWMMRGVDQIIPLLNARKEGIVNSVQGLLDDPQRAASRMTMYFGLPTVSLYAMNRLAYGEAYDDIPSYEKDLYFHIPYGWWTDDQNRSHPLTLKIVKSPFVQVMTAPLEHLLDTNYHLMADGQYLAENQRTQRPTQRMWVEQLSRMSIFEGRPDAFADMQHFGSAALGLVPVGTFVAEMVGGEDLFTGKPIIPPERQILPAEYQYGIGTSLVARALGKATHVSPAIYDRFAADIFGTAGRAAMHMPDAVYSALQKDGLIPPGDPFAPQRIEDIPSLKDVPPELAYRFLDQMQHEDQRPFEARFFSRFFGTSFGGRTIQRRAHEAGVEDRHHWESTLHYQEAQQAQVAKYNRMRAELEDSSGKMTHYGYRQAQHSINDQERGSLDTLAQEWKLKGAWTDYQERIEARKRLPGVDIENFKRELASLPPETDLARLLAEYKQPPELAAYDPVVVAGNPRLLAQSRNQWLQQTSTALRIDVGTLLSYLGAQSMGQALSGLPVPGADVDLLRARFRAPVDPTTGLALDPLSTPIDTYAAAQRQVVRDTAASWGVEYETVKSWLNSRLHMPGESTGSVHAELRRAQMLERAFHEPDKYPRYGTPNGKPVGTEQDWDIYDRRIDAAKNAYGNKEDRWPEGIRTLATLRRYGDAHRYMDMYKLAQDSGERLKDLIAWERFYGTGRQITLDQWSNFYDNPQAKYAGAKSVEQALTWDMLYKIWRTLPDSPVKSQYEPVAKAIQRQARPAWARLLEPDGGRITP